MTHYQLVAQLLAHLSDVVLSVLVRCTIRAHLAALYGVRIRVRVPPV